MIRLKVGLLVADLASRFNVSVGTVSSIVISWVNLMYVDLKALCELPLRDATCKDQSNVFNTFKDVCVVLDCTELFVQSPSLLGAKKQMFSNYKHHITYKFLVGKSPQLAVTYIRRMFGGRASEMLITTTSTDLMDYLNEQKGAVMVDRGFLVHAERNDIGIKVYIPAFKRFDRPQLQGNEIKTSESVLRTRTCRKGYSANQNVSHFLMVN